jgi:archaellum biogenesis protein FlaJ (TadC family)
MANRIFTNMRFWPLTGERRQLAVQHWLIYLLMVSFALIGTFAMMLSVPRSSTWYAGIVVLVASLFAVFVQSIYMISTRRTNPQLIYREFKDARKRSIENTKEVEQFMADQSQKVKPGE